MLTKTDRASAINFRVDSPGPVPQDPDLIEANQKHLNGSEDTFKAEESLGGTLESILVFSACMLFVRE